MHVLSPHAAYLLVAHGSRDLRSQSALDQLGQLVHSALQEQLGYAPWVRTATLEFGPVPLKQQICDWGNGLYQDNIQRLVILPLFLLPGTHVKVDIPDVIATVRHFLDERMCIEVRSHLGSHPNIIQLLHETRLTDQIDRWILLAHGSRYPGGNAPVEHIASQLGIEAAYWSVQPSLRQQVAAIATQPGLRVGIKPYFLFTGSIIDAILQEVHQLKCDFKHISLTLASPLEPNPQLVHLIQDLIVA